jgi:biotin transport system substrate-specific component
LITAELRALDTREQTRVIARALLAAGGFAVALAIAAQVRIPLPFTPVPITLQTLVLYVGGAWLGARVAVSGLALYVGAALLGVPVLSGLRGGLAAFTGATGGYIVGWLLALLLVSATFRGRRLRWPASVGSMFAASSLILLCGALHLALLLDLGPAEAFVMGVAPFLPGDALKILSASVAVRRWPNPFGFR